MINAMILRTLNQYKFLKGNLKKNLSKQNPVDFLSAVGSQEEREEAGVARFDFAEWNDKGEQIMPIVGTPTGPLKKFLEHFSEDDIAKSPMWSFFYACARPRRGWSPEGKWDRNYLGWPKGEPAIAKTPYTAYRYAFDCLGGHPFPLGEPIIATDGTYAERYARRILHAPFPAGEEAIAKAAPAISEDYAQHVLKLPHPLCDEWAEKYLKGDFMEKQASGEMSRGKLMEALKALSDALGECDMKAQVTALGGAAIMLSFTDFPRSVKDVDVFYDYKQSSPDLDEAIMNELIQEVGVRENLHHEWMNNGVQPYIWLPDNLTYKNAVTLPNLTVRVPNPEYLFANKLDSGRKEEKGNDTKDVRFLVKKLGLTTSKEIMAMYKTYYPSKHPGTFTFEEACQAIGE